MSDQDDALARLAACASDPSLPHWLVEELQSLLARARGKLVKLTIKLPSEELLALTADPELNFVSAFVSRLEREGVELRGWNEANVLDLRARAWVCAHRFIADNVELVDRSEELRDLAKVLRVKT